MTGTKLNENEIIVIAFVIWWLKEMAGEGGVPW